MHFKFVEESFVKLKESLTSAIYFYTENTYRGEICLRFTKEKKNKSQMTFPRFRSETYLKEGFSRRFYRWYSMAHVTQQRFGNESHYK